MLKCKLSNIIKNKVIKEYTICDKESAILTAKNSLLDHDLHDLYIVYEDRSIGCLTMRKISEHNFYISEERDLTPG